MKLGRLKEIIKGMDDDDIEIFVRNSNNICGNMGYLEQIEVSTYGSFGIDMPCLILNADNSKEIETNEEDEYIDIIK